MKKEILIVMVLILGRTSMTLAEKDTWTYRTNMPTERTWVSGCVLDGKIYVTGGSPNQSSSTSVVEMYDPTTDTWTKMANMPAGRSAHVTCELDGKIYVFGGIGSGVYSSATKTVYVYDPQTDIWTQKTDMPFANAFCGIAVIDDTIYLIGGSLSISSPPIPTLMAYNPVTESWMQKADMPTARLLLTASVVDGKIYAFGGSTENWTSFCYQHVEVYDPVMDTWTRKSDMPTARTSLGSCVADGKIYAIGGYLPTQACMINELYDTATNSWTTKSQMQQKRLGHFVGSVGGKIYAIGGSYPNPQPTHISIVEEYDTGIGPRSPDFNCDGIVDRIDICILIEHWQTDYPLCDIAPPPFGDGIVNVLDLIEVAEHLFEEIYPPELIVYWKLDEAEGDIAEDTEGDNDGIVYGDAFWQPIGGMKNGALQLDGIDDYISTDFVLNPADGPFSVFAWINSSVLGGVVISQLDGIGGSGETWLGTEAVSGKLMTGLVAPAVGRFKPEPLISESVITDGQWHNVGFVWDGIHRFLYVDGVEVAKDAAAQNPMKSATGGLYIGVGKNLEAGTFFSGLIDDVRIFNRVVIP